MRLSKNKIYKILKKNKKSRKQFKKKKLIITNIEIHLGKKNLLI